MLTQDRTPQRIVCLTTETVEVLYALGEQDRIVGIAGYTTRPAAARKDKPKVSAFTTAKIDKILALKPDLVLGFSNLQADIDTKQIKINNLDQKIKNTTIKTLYDPSQRFMDVTEWYIAEKRVWK